VTFADAEFIEMQAGGIGPVPVGDFDGRCIDDLLLTHTPMASTRRWR
jgi:hypothetical protein